MEYLSEPRVLHQIPLIGEYFRYKGRTAVVTNRYKTSFAYSWTNIGLENGVKTCLSKFGEHLITNKYWFEHSLVTKYNGLTLI